MDGLKNKVTMLLIILTITISSIVGIVNAWGTDGNYWGGNGLPAGGSTYGCPDCGTGGFGAKILANGYRVTIVDKDGKRVKDDDNNDSLSFDYWHNIITSSDSWDTSLGYKGLDDNNVTNPNHYRGAQNWCEKQTSKTEDTCAGFISGKKDTNYVKRANTALDEFVIDSETGKVRNDLSIKISLNGGHSTFKGVDSGGQGTTLETNNGFIAYVLAAVKKEIDSESAKTAGYKKFVRLINNAGISRDTNRETIYAVKDYYLLIEPTMAIAMKGKVYIGTYKELYDRAGDMKSSNGHVLFTDEGGAYTARSYYNPFSYYDGSEKLAGIESCSDLRYPIAWDNRPYMAKNKCLGVFIVSLSELNSGCPEKVKEAYKKLNDKTSDDYHNTAKYNTDVTNACKEANLDDCDWLLYENYGKYYTNDEMENLNSCDLNCNTFASKHEDDSDILSKLKTGWKGWIPVNDGKKYKIDVYKRYGIRYENEYCNPSPGCETLLSKLRNNNNLTKDNLAKLYEDYPEYNLLNYSVIEKLSESTDESVILEGAQCDTTPECIVDRANAKCNFVNHEFTISDFTIDNTYNSGHKFNMTRTIFAQLTAPGAAKNCLNTSTAYNLVRGADDDKITVDLQSSEDITEYGSPSKPAICWEEVSFDMPLYIGSEANPIIAGTNFRWGVDGNFEDTSSNLFGRMTVHRFCTITKYKNSSYTKAEIGNEWANVIGGKSLIGAIPGSSDNTPISHAVYDKNALINPKITLYYKQALPTIAIGNRSKFEEVNGIDLNVELSFVETSVYQRKDDGSLSTIVDADDRINYELEECNENSNYDACVAALGADDHPRRTTLDKDHHPLFFKNGGVIETTARYNIVYNDKLYWYSDRSDNAKKKTKNDIEADHKNPTDAKYESLGYGLPTSFVTPTSYDYDESYGYLVSAHDGEGQMYVNITNVGTKNKDGSFHFDNILDLAVDDEDPTGAIPGIVYSCGFVIKNNLYCSEGTCNGGGAKSHPGGGGSKTYHTPNGLDVVFRTVNLISDSSEINTVFPGRSGSGRKRGFNWTKKMGYNLDDSTLAYILNDSIYSETPLYKINLDTETIQNIRKINSTESYTQMSDYVFTNYKVEVDDYDAGFAQDKLVECTNRGRSDKGCISAKFLLDIYVKGVLTAKFDLKEINYTYAASPFLSRLAEGKYGHSLEGSCIDGLHNTEARANKHVTTLGC